MATPGQSLIIGFLAGKLRRAREAKEIPVVRQSTLDPNIPALYVCLNEGPSHEEWYAVYAEPLAERPKEEPQGPLPKNVTPIWSKR